MGVLGTDRVIARLIVIIAATAIVTATACDGSSANPASTDPVTTNPVTTDPESADTTSVDETSTDIEPSAEVFSRRSAVIFDADGSTCELCLWIADTDEERGRGLMGVTALGSADGMAFVYDRPTAGKFWMKDTLIPLDIVFFDGDGERVGRAEMTPCTTSNCPVYGPDGRFQTAVEFEVGYLDKIGIADVARLELDGAECNQAAASAR